MESKSLARKVTAVGTVGEVGQLFTVYEKNWNCVACGQENYASRPKCFRCRKNKPEGASAQNYVSDPALEAYKSGVVCHWQEVIDPTSYQIYYYNAETGATQWERPVELGEAPMATGWFGRGQAGSTAANMYNKLNEKYLEKGARKQKDFIDPHKYHLEGAQEYNIWYGKFIGEDFDNSKSKEPAADRCVVNKDAGRTKADTRPSGNNKKTDRRYFCLHFARGMCAKGSDCSYYHRLPLPEDDAACDELYDCFGRPRHNKHKEDMNGVGSFMNPCRTLFVGNLLKSKYTSPKELEDSVWRHFAEWGELENVNVIHRLSIAFPRYRLRTSSEFAKEAMQCQALDKEEILSIRWARDDPNPVAKDAIERANKDALTALFRARGICLESGTGFDYPADYQVPSEASETLNLENASEAQQGEEGDDEDVVDPAHKKTRVSVDGYAAMGVTSYPNTDKQYINGFDTSSTVDNGSSGDAWVQAANQDEPTEVRAVAAEAEADADTGDSAGEWIPCTDPSTGAVYYYHSVTNEVSWGTETSTAPTTSTSSSSTAASSS